MSTPRCQLPNCKKENPDVQTRKLHYRASCDDDFQEIVVCNAHGLVEEDVKRLIVAGLVRDDRKRPKQVDDFIVFWDEKTNKYDENVLAHCAPLNSKTTIYLRGVSLNELNLSHCNIVSIDNPAGVDLVVFLNELKISTGVPDVAKIDFKDCAYPETCKFYVAKSSYFNNNTDIIHNRIKKQVQTSSWNAITRLLGKYDVNWNVERDPGNVMVDEVEMEDIEAGEEDEMKDINNEDEKHDIDSDEGKPRDNQELVGNLLFKKLLSMLPTGDLSAFKAVNYLILVPPNIGLYDQTVLRLSLFLNWYSKQFQERQPPQQHEPEDEVSTIEIAQSHVVRAVKPRERKGVRLTEQKNPQVRKMIDFYTSAYENPQVLHILIQDECHWGCDKNGMIAKFLHNPQQEEPANLFNVLVSATLQEVYSSINAPDETPMNTSADDDKTISLKDRIVLFDAALEGAPDGMKNAYISRHDLISRGKVLKAPLPPDDEKLLHNEMKLEKQMQFRMAPYEVLATYVLALFGIQFSENCIGAKQLVDNVRSLEENKSMVVIRLPANGKRTRGVKECFIYVLKQVRDRADRNFEVLFDTSSERLEVAQFKHPPHRKLVQEHMKETENSNIFFSHLKNIPCFLLLVEKGRMGYTFPPSFKIFDLRMRFEGDSRPSTTTLWQDFGRAQGYGERPMVLLGRNCYKYVATSDGFNNVPGPHSKRIKQSTEEKKERKTEQDMLHDNHMNKATQRMNVVDDDDDADTAVTDDDNADAAADGEDQSTQDWFNKEIDFYQKAFTAETRYSDLSLKCSIFLAADTQKGKTGSFLWLLYRLLDHFDSSERKEQVRVRKTHKRKTQLAELNRKYYQMPNTEFHSFANTDAGKEELKKYHKLCKFAEEYRDEHNLMHPFKCAIEIMNNNWMLQNGPSIAELCAGYAPIKYLLGVNNQTNVDSYDIEAKTEHSNDRYGVAVTARNCMDINAWDDKKASYDIVTCVSGLFGSDYHHVFDVAHSILKNDPGKIFIIVEFASHLQFLEQGGISFQKAVNSAGFMFQECSDSDSNIRVFKLGKSFKPNSTDTTFPIRNFDNDRDLR